MTEHPCHPLLNVLDDAPAVLGAPFKITIGGGGVGPVLAPPKVLVGDVLRLTTSTQNCSSYGKLGVYERQHLGGIDAWLLVSWRIDGVLDEPPHDSAVAAHELEGEYRVRWVDRVRCAGVWHLDGNYMKLLTVDVPRRTMRELALIYGAPDRDGQWLFSRLLPRRLPGCVRRVEPHHLQLWIAL